MKNFIYEIIASILISVIVSLCIIGAEHLVYTIFGVPFVDFSTSMSYCMKGSFWAVYTTYTCGKHFNSKKKGE